MMPEAPTMERASKDLVPASRVLAYEGVLDGFGHVSARHPHHRERYLLSRSRSPELVARGTSVRSTSRQTPSGFTDIAFASAFYTLHPGDVLPERSPGSAEPIRPRDDLVAWRNA